MAKIELHPTDRLILEALADSGMNATAAAKKAYVCRNTVTYRMKKLRQATGLDPMDFYDLQTLLDVTRPELPCKWLEGKTCINKQCPMVCEECPVVDYAGVCRYDTRGGADSEKAR